MKRGRFFNGFVFFTLSIWAVLLLSGCEDSENPGESDLDSYFANNPYLSDPRGSSQSPMRIAPGSASVSIVGQQAVFTAHGGSGPYQWDVSIPANGTIDFSQNWRQGVYTASSISKNDVIVYDRNGHAAIAAINVDADSSITELSATASPDSLASDGDKSSLTATGGQPPYSWSVHDVALGNISSTSGDSVLYTRYNAGDNGVNVTDQNGDNVYLVIKQP